MTNPNKFGEFGINSGNISLGVPQQIRREFGVTTFMDMTIERIKMYINTPSFNKT